MTKKFSHLDNSGNVKMVSITNKLMSKRKASASAEIEMDKKTLNILKDNKLPKGNVLTTSKIAGILAAKKTSELIPLCHQLNLTNIDLEFIYEKQSLKIFSYCETNNSTGVEMEALTAVSLAALTVYDMCKSIDKKIIIQNIKLVNKTGGKTDIKN